ncbi:type I polyketide synthase [Ilumatobacter sp.]|uniref:type I polyketide synthase n=1 Tax=Ilumatobacter sp. TaxID=1967498 RepID=UPI003B528BFD
MHDPTKPDPTAASSDDPVDGASSDDSVVDENAVAIVGMSCRYAGANDPDELWAQVVAGNDCLVDVDDALAPASAGHAGSEWIGRTGVIDDVEMFDPGFFGMSPRDAAITDPQQRLFLECAWEALESAGLLPERTTGPVGVFGGVGTNTYLLHHLFTNPDLVDRLGWFQLRHTGNDKDFLTTSVAYRLDLHGPAFSVQTACSTSLVAVHLAVQSLLSFECDTALAGGSTVEFPHGAGYVFREGEVLSSDGVCRAFDAESTGTVLTSGVGMVALRRLADAVEADDPILAVIRGSAVNNDGAGKVSFLAPSVDGHADVVKEALAVSGIDARTIELLEAHGTGTRVGDPIEVAALTEAFRTDTDDRGFCRIGSVKPNIGHTDTAAGVASLITAVQALRHRILPPLANHTAPNPLMGLERTPFIASDRATPWHSIGPRRAGVSSLGVGGTNAHVIVEEAPEPRAAHDREPRAELLVVSARSDASVATYGGCLAAHLDHHLEPPAASPADGGADVERGAVTGAPSLADVAFTLATGRAAMAHRASVVASPSRPATASLRRIRATTVEEAPRIALMFPGGGAGHVAMATTVDERFEVFRREFAEGTERWREATGEVALDLISDAESLERPTVNLPLVFLTSVAMGRQLEALGIRADAMIGHSLGEYSAAHLAGVFDLQTGLDLVIRRSELVEKAGASDVAEMVVIPFAEEHVRRHLVDGAEIAAVNAVDECVIAGPSSATSATVDRLGAEADVVRLPLRAPGHHSLLDPYLDEFEALLRTVDLRAPDPSVRLVSNVTGEWLTPEQATSPRYWVDHLRSTVRFAQGLELLRGIDPTLVIECGPGQSLAPYVQRAGEMDVVGTMRHPRRDADDTESLLAAIGRAWTAGVDVDLGAVTDGRRIPLPTYAFDRQRCLIEPGPVPSVLAGPEASGSARTSNADAAPVASALVERIDDLDDGCWIDEWVNAPDPLAASTVGGSWVVVADDDDALASALIEELGSRGASVVRRRQLRDLDGDVTSIVVVSGVDPDDGDRARTRWTRDALVGARCVGAASGGLLAGVTRSALGEGIAPAVRPLEALARGVLGVAPAEYPGLRVRHVDVGRDADDHPTSVAPAVVDDLLGELDLVRHRDGRRSVRQHRRAVPPVASDVIGMRDDGVYVVTGGLGGVGFELARSLLLEPRRRVVVTTTSDVPRGDAAERWLERHGIDDDTTRRIRRLDALEELPGEVSALRADVADASSVATLLASATDRHGRVDGVVHAAGVLRDQLIELADDAAIDITIDVKAGGAHHLVGLAAASDVELVVLVSSTSTVLNPPGQFAYVAANAVLDAYGGTTEGLRVATIRFGVWADVGLASLMAARDALGLGDPSEPVEHPVWTERIESTTGAVVLAGRLDNEHHWMTDDHRNGVGTALLPATGHVELLLDAVRRVDPSCTTLNGILIPSPLVVADGSAVDVRAVVERRDGARSVRLESFDHRAGEWYTRSEARWDSAPDVGSDAISVASVPDAAGEVVDPFARQRPHLRLGDRWPSESLARSSGSAVIGTLAVAAEHRSDVDAWRVHPALVDGAIALATLLAPMSDPERLLAPVSIDKVVSRRTVPAEVEVSAGHVRSEEDDRGRRTHRFDVAMRDRDDDVVLELHGLILAEVDGSALGPLDHADDVPAEVVLATDQPVSLVSMADRFGIRAGEGLGFVERLLASAAPSMTGSTIDLAELAPRTGPAEATPSASGGSSAPSDGETVETALVAIWSELLGIDDIADDDDFFDLGGHSLLAIRMLAQVQHRFQVRVPLATIFEVPTVATLAGHLRAEMPDAADPSFATPAGVVPADGAGASDGNPSLIVSVGGDGPRRPLYVVHGAGGNVIFLWTLGRALSGERRVYGIRARGVDGREEPDDDIDVMARRYVEQLRAHSAPPYLIGGFSGGGLVALEMARLLIAEGCEVQRVVLFDSVPPGRTELTSVTRRRNILRNLVRQGYDAVAPYLSSVRRAWTDRLLRRQPDEETRRTLDELGYGTKDFGVVDLFDHFSEVAVRHPLRQYDVDALLISADLVWPTQPIDYYWRPNVTGRLEVHHVSGDHRTMFSPENAPEIARIVSRWTD